jgi:hypothetical protein
MITAAEVLAAARKRRLLCEQVDVAQPATAGKVLAAFEASMEERSDLGLLNRAANVLLEARNPFDPGRRRIAKVETVIFGALFVLVIAAVLSFNLAAPRVQVCP